MTSTADFAGSQRILYRRLNQRCTGMEFATEMIIKSSLYSEKIAEVPITLHPDGRKSHAPHLKTFRDGWRTLRFFLMYSPRWLFLAPGVLLVMLGVIGYAPGAAGHQHRSHYVRCPYAAVFKPLFALRIPNHSFCHLHQNLRHR